MPIFIGTAGYVYSHWRRNAFYPTGLPAQKELSHYLSHYPSVEINATFHAFPRVTTLKKWRSAAHTQTLFALKAPGQITHQKRLVCVADDVNSFLHTAASLGPHLGPVLFQCPPSLHLSLPLLSQLLAIISDARATCDAPNLRVALEFRSREWFCQDVYNLLAQHDVALVNNVVVRDDDFTAVNDQALPHRRSNAEGPRAKWVYNRFHGSKNPGVSTAFPDVVLRQFAKEAVTGMKNVPGYVEFSFFLNDLDAVAPQSARRYAELVAEEAGVRVREIFEGFVPMWTKKKNSIASFFKKQPMDTGKAGEKGKATDKGGNAKALGASEGAKNVQDASAGPVAPKPRIASPKPTISKTRASVAGSKSPKKRRKSIASYFAPVNDKG